MGATKVLLTAEEFDNYPFKEDKRYELDEGELIEMTRPAFEHNRVLLELLIELGNYFRKNPWVWFSSPRTSMRFLPPRDGRQIWQSFSGTGSRNYGKRRSYQSFRILRPKCSRLAKRPG